MALDPSLLGLEPDDDPWQALDRLVEELGLAARHETAAAAFAATVAERLALATEAPRAAVWWRGSEAAWTRGAVAGSSAPAHEPTATADAWPAEFEALARRGLPGAVGVASSVAAGAVQPSSSALAARRLAAPAMVEGRPVALVELALRDELPPDVERGYLRLLAAVAEALAEFVRHEAARRLARRVEEQERLATLTAELHASLDPRDVAQVLANEGRRFAAWDRASVAERRGDGYRLLATSGLARVDRRAAVVVALEALLGRVLASGEPLWHPGPADLPREIREPLDTYLDLAHVRTVAILPLARRGDEPQAETPRPAGALVLERFESAPSDDDDRRRLAALALHGGVALANARDHRRVPLVWLLAPLGQLAGDSAGRPGARWALAALAVVVGAALLAWPVAFDLTAPGELQPAERRDVFAPRDAVVTRVTARQGQRVESGEPLVELHDPALEVESARVLGELQTARQRLASLSAARLSGADDAAPGSTSRGRATLLAAEEEPLKQRIAGLEAELALLRAEREALVVRAPAPGVVVTWDAEQRLLGKPVARGEPLVRVAADAGPWVVDARLADGDAGHLRRAAADAPEGLRASAVVASAPGITLAGRVAEVAGAAEFDAARGGVLPVTIALDADAPPADLRRAGATARARIHCGRRPLGYVWFREAWDAIRGWIGF